MFNTSFTSFFSDSVNSYLVVESKQGIIKHLTHLEEYILTQQKEGLNIAVNFLEDLYNTFKGHSTGRINTTVKYDGSPAIIAGYNPENGDFFVSTKSFANKTPKVNYTNDQIDKNYEGQTDLANKLKLALEYLPNVITENIYQGDYMFSADDLKILTYKEEKFVTFTPNTITYAIPVDSDLGKKVLKSKFGIVFHTRLTGPTLQELHKSFDVNYTEFNQAKNVWFDDAKFKDVSGIATLTQSEDELFLQEIARIKEAGNVVKWNNLEKEAYLKLNTYINSLIQKNTFVNSPEDNFYDFINWVKEKTVKDINKLKTERGQNKAYDELNSTLSSYESNKHNFINIFNLTIKLEKLKSLFVKKYDESIKTKQFIIQDDGSLQVTNNEGYVAVDHIGNMVKLINRLEFSRANFTKSKNRK
jgi:hypothetical protein